MAKEITYVWLICYIDSENIETIEKDLNKKKIYKGIEHFVPLVKILSKKFKGKNIYDHIPLLFNYGFFKVPIEKATNKEFLSGMKSDIKGIYAWVKDGMRRDKESLYYRIPLAIATPEEIKNLIKSQLTNSIYSAEDLERVKEGQIVNLKGYPFENMDAEVLRIDFVKKEVKVSLQMGNIFKEVIVSFDNVFYSIYHGGYDETVFKEKSLDEIKERNNGSIDKLYANFITPANDEIR
jgi:transcription antitermination factor NusG